MTDPWSQKHAADRAKPPRRRTQRTDPGTDPAVQERIAARGKARTEAKRPEPGYPCRAQFSGLVTVRWQTATLRTSIRP